MHGLRLIIKEDVLPISDQPKFEVIAEVAWRHKAVWNRRYIEAKRGKFYSDVE